MRLSPHTIMRMGFNNMSEAPLPDNDSGRAIMEAYLADPANFLQNWEHEGKFPRTGANPQERQGMPLLPPGSNIRSPEEAAAIERMYHEEINKSDVQKFIEWLVTASPRT